jgi:3-isopropylmalate dehydrogenase
MATEKTYNVVLLPGDGIGPEVTSQAVRVLEAAGAAYGFAFRFTEGAVGGAAIDAYGTPLPDDVLEQCRKADAVFLGAVGGPKWDDLRGAMRPESGLLKLRKSLEVFANLRPVAVPESLAEASPLRPEAVRGTDMLVVRELTGGIYFGEPKGRTGEGQQEEAFNTMRYSVPEIERVARVAFQWARRRKGKLTSVDKANVLVVSQLWRETVERIHAAEFSDVKLDHMYVDNAAMQLVLNPRQFDVIVTGNLFGDILSDAAATLGGSLGLLPSASVGGKVGLFEPVHGSAPDIAGQAKANPVAAILTAAMLLDELGESQAAVAVREAVEQVFADGYRTGDLWREGYKKVGTSEMGDLVLEQIARVPQEVNG